MIQNRHRRIPSILKFCFVVLSFPFTCSKLQVLVHPDTSVDLFSDTEKEACCAHLFLYVPSGNIPAFQRYNICLSFGGFAEEDITLVSVCRVRRQTSFYAYYYVYSLSAKKYIQHRHTGTEYIRSSDSAHAASLAVTQSRYHILFCIKVNVNIIIELPQGGA